MNLLMKKKTYRILLILQQAEIDIAFTKVIQ